MKSEKNYDLKISSRDTKVMAFLGQYPIRNKIVVDDNPTEQVAHFNTHVVM
jgi:hypothetical protein